MTDLIHLIYSSTASQPMQPQDLLGLVTKAQEKNKQLSITGVLLHNKDHFLQVIEGRRTVVDNLFRVIVKDPRHKDVTLLLKRRIPNREYDSWHMGFIDMHTINNSKLSTYAPYLNESFNSPRFREIGFASTLLKLLKTELR